MCDGLDQYSQYDGPSHDAALVNLNQLDAIKQ